MRGPFENVAFRRLFAGRVITNVGDSLYFVAAMWLVYSLTDDPLYTGVAGFVTLGPQVLQFLAGPLVDRWSIRRTLVGTQAVQAVIVSTIPIAHGLGVLTVEVVLIVMPVLAGLNQLVYPAQTAALPRLLDDEELVAANSAFAVAYQGLEMVANGIGGVLIGLVGAVSLFVIDAVTFAIAATVFLTVSIPAAGAQQTPEESPGDGQPTPDESENDADESAVVADGGAEAGTAEGDATSQHDSYLARLREGAALLRGTVLLWLVLGALVVNFTSGMVLAVIPVYADSLVVPAAVSAVGAAGAYGLLMAAFAAGNFLGAITANAVSEAPMGKTMIVGLAVSGVVWTVAIGIDWLPLTTVLIALALLPVGVVNVQVAAVVQSAVPEEYVGRMSSMLGSASTAVVPLGSLAGGIVAATFSAHVAMFAFGFGAVSLALYVLALPTLRRLPAPDEVELDHDAV